MTQTADMQAAITNLQSELTAKSGLSSDQVSALITQALSPLQTQVETIMSGEQTDEAKLADVSSAIGVVITAFAPAAPAASTPNAAPAGPAPASDAAPAATAAAPATV